jgi:hypothetical protein
VAERTAHVAAPRAGARWTKRRWRGHDYEWGCVDYPFS